MGTETAIQLWSISGKYALNLQHIHCTITLKQFGGVGIGGTSKKYGTKEIFPVIIPLLFSGGISQMCIRDRTIEVNLGNGKQTYTVSGIMDVENDSRMFQLYVSEAFVEEMAQGEDVYKRQPQAHSWINWIFSFREW